MRRSHDGHQKERGKSRPADQFKSLFRIETWTGEISEETLGWTGRNCQEPFGKNEGSSMRAHPPCSPPPSPQCPQFTYHFCHFPLRSPLGHETKTAMCAGMLALPVVQPQPLIHLYLAVFQAGHLPFAVSVSLRKPSSFNRIATLCLFRGDQLRTPRLHTVYTTPPARQQKEKERKKETHA